MVKSMFAAVAGLRTHQQKMDVIGNNIANVNTYAYKKARVAFADQFYATLTKASDAGETFGGGNPSQVGYGSQVGSVDVNYGTGGRASTDIGTDVMIDGQGFFLLGGRNENGYSTTSGKNGNGLASLSDLYLTRVGIFGFDGQGNMINVNKQYAYGYKNYAPAGEAPIYGSYTKDANGEPVKDANGNIIIDQNKVEMISVPDAYANMEGAALYLARTATTDNTVNPPTTTYDYSVTTDATKGIMCLTPKNSTLDTDGKIEKVTVPNPDFDSSLPAGANNKKTIEITLPADTATTPRVVAQAAPMKLSNMSISSNGMVTGVNDLKQTVVLGKLALANVINPNALENMGAGLMKAGANTGLVTAETPGGGSTGALATGVLEMSNVDLSQEFTDMITTQRGFQANTRIITVTDEMLQELVNIKR